jgi:hypothetical protein
MSLSVNLQGLRVDQHFFHDGLGQRAVGVADDREEENAFYTSTLWLLGTC